MKEINKKLVAPAIIAVAVYLLSYQIPKIVVDPSRLHFLHTSLDDKVPFYGPSIFIYIGAFFQWAYCIYVLMKQKTEIGSKYFNAITIGSLIGFVIFMVYPTAVYRPEIIGSGFTNDFCRFIYSVDSIVCACPSFHCFCSTLVILAYRECEGVSNEVKNINMFISLIVYISTLLTKQHYIADIIPGIALAYFAVLISNKFSIFR